jgi:hypothetical protein
MAEQLRVRQDLADLDVLDSLIAEVEQQFTTAVASIASKMRTRKEGRPKSSSTALSLRLA